MNRGKSSFLVLFALLSTFSVIIEGASYTNLRKRSKPDPDCSCGDWKYVEQCGQDCRQFRWRDCNPENCAVEDESVPCYTVEWGEWGACDPGTCTRTRTELCMCLARIVSPAICWMDMATETEPCASEIETGAWSPCDENCWRERTRTCSCVNPGTGLRTTVQNSICGLSFNADNERQTCPTRVESSAWTQCDDDCLQERTSKCLCDDNGSSFEINTGICNIVDGEKDKRGCATEWGDWITHEQCPDVLPEGDCSPHVRKIRFCYCINTSDQTKFSTRDRKCGREPSKASFNCPIPEKCTCSVCGGTPAICKISCNEDDEGWAIGSVPTCSCSPLWYKGQCHPDQMKPDRRFCEVQPSKWNEWEAWTPATCDGSCQQTRTRTCGCFDGNILHDSDISKCAGGYADESRECETEWGVWNKKTCPEQKKGECKLTTKEYRQCNCKLNPGLKMTSAKCEGDFHREVDCIVPKPCECAWDEFPPNQCDRKKCEPYVVEQKPAVCRCTPWWYKGECDQRTKPTLPSLPTPCPPVIPFEWENWSGFSACDTVHTCAKRRSRQCSCYEPGEKPIYRAECGPDDEETITCDREWGPWENGCRESLCTEATAVKTRKCYCKSSIYLSWGTDAAGNHDPVEAQRECGSLGGKSTEVEQCSVKDFDMTQWSEWSGCDMTCKRKKKRDCQCTDRNQVYRDITQCPDDNRDSIEEECQTEWSEWSEPDCGEKTCTMKTRPKFRKCNCKDPPCEVSRDSCEGNKFEMAVKCEPYPPEHPACTGCDCSDWICSPSCDNTFVRTCGPVPGCAIEVNYVKEDCCAVAEKCTCSEWRCTDSCDATMVRNCENNCDIEAKVILEPCCEKPCVCSPWECKDSCDASMIRQCEDGCDIEEKVILEPCCEKPCVCSPWECKDSCDASMIRQCEDGCDIEEKVILEPCCEKPCECSSWRCKDVCDATMIRECVDGCDLEEKVILEPCCRGEPAQCTCSEWECTEDCFNMKRECTPRQCELERKPIEESCCDDGGTCECGNWVGISCLQEGDACQHEEWRGCSPEFCDTQVRSETTTGIDCCNNSNVPDDCSACGRWIWIGECQYDEAGIFQGDGENEHQWRSVQDCDKTICDEFRCVPATSKCIEKNCGDWYDIGDCENEPGKLGKHQWRSAEDCHCEPYRCYVEEELGSLEACTCTPWLDITGCDAQCVNTEARQCYPNACEEEYRIQSGFCCDE